MSGQEEFFDIVNDDDVIVGCASRRECHGNPGLIHRAVHVLVFNPWGELLLQQRAPHKDIQPGRWDTSVGGHLDLGESYLAAARREMAEELGLAGLPLTFLYHSRIRNPIESENIATYLTVAGCDVVYEPEEISAVRYWPHNEIEQFLGLEVFTPNFEEEWRMLNRFMRRHLDECGLRCADSFPDLWAAFMTKPPV